MTAANSSSISDGAAALVLMRALDRAKRAACDAARGDRRPRDPRAGAGWFTTAPVGAIRRLFEKTGWSADDVDLYEINEAFAVVAMAAMREHGLPHEKVNVHGGACALGHPIGASGARILVTLLGALRKRGAEARRRVAVHRRRRGHGHGDRAALKRELQRLLDPARFLRPYGFRVVRPTARMHARVAAQAALERPGGIINGPALMAAADCAMWLAIKVRLGMEDDALTSELNTAFPGAGERRACLLHRADPQDGRRRIYGTAECHAQGRASSSATTP